jgi:hypothetical protein
MRCAVQEIRYPASAMSFTDIANVSTLVSLLISGVSLYISIKVLLNLRDIEKKFLFTATAPKHLAEMRNAASEIQRNVEDFPDTMRQIDLSIKTAGVHVKRLIEKTDGEMRESLETTYDYIQAYEETTRQQKNKNRIWEIYDEIVCRVVEMESRISDTKYQQ